MKSSHYHRIKIFPDPCLRTPIPELQNVKHNKVAKTANILKAVMKSHKHGIGIAAPQIGVMIRLAVVDVSSRVSGAQCLVLVNPMILAQEHETLSREGCMSVPDYRGDIKRYRRIRLIWQDLMAESHDQWFEGIEAICIQHEVDHLDGKLFIDRVASLKRDLIPRK